MRIELKDIDPDIAQRLTSNATVVGLVAPTPPPVIAPGMAPPTVTGGRIGLAALWVVLGYLASLIILGTMVQAKMPDTANMPFFCATLLGIPWAVYRWTVNGEAIA